MQFMLLSSSPLSSDYPGNSPDSIPPGSAALGGSGSPTRLLCRGQEAVLKHDWMGDFYKANQFWPRQTSFSITSRFLVTERQSNKNNTPHPQKVQGIFYNVHCPGLLYKQWMCYFLPRHSLIATALSFFPLQILPPITAAAVSDPVVPVCAKRAHRRAQRAAALLMRPEPPRAALIHLEVTARSHEHLECFKHFPEQFNKLHGWNMIYSVTITTSFFF